jgi:hypothetical protein
VVRERSAKPLCVGSIPTRASNLFLQLPESTVFNSFSSFVLVRAQSEKIGLNWGGGCHKTCHTVFAPIFNSSPFHFAERRLFGGHQSFVVFLHEFSLVFCRRVNILLNHPKRVVP